MIAGAVLSREDLTWTELSRPISAKNKFGGIHRHDVREVLIADVAVRHVCTGYGSLVQQWLRPFVCAS